jgi:DNA-directed RNA polymerase subunit RPC12/RpoP
MIAPCERCGRPARLDPERADEMVCTGCGHRGRIPGAAGQELREAGAVRRTARARFASAAWEEGHARRILWRARLAFLPALLGWVLAPAGCAGIGASNRDWSTLILWGTVALCGLLTLAVVIAISRRGSDDVIDGLSDGLDPSRGPKVRIGPACKNCGAALEAANIDATARCAHCGADNALDADRVERAYAPRVKAAAWVSVFVGARAKEGAERIRGLGFWTLPTAFFVPLVWVVVVMLTLGGVRVAGAGDRTFPLVTLADGRRCVAARISHSGSKDWIDFEGRSPRGVESRVEVTAARSVETITSASLRDRTVIAYGGPTGVVLRIERELSDLDKDLLVIATAPDAPARIPGTCLEEQVR